MYLETAKQYPYRLPEKGGEELPMRLQIELAGLTVFIDEVDFERVAEKNWHAYEAKSGFLIQTRARVNGRSVKINLGRFIMLGCSSVGVEDDSNSVVIQKPGFARFDFTREALMMCSMSERQATSTKRKAATTSIYKGVSFAKRTGRWRASIRPQGGSMYLGEFDSEAEAALAYNAAARKYFGESAFQNDVALENKTRLNVIPERSREEPAA
ncbi:MAG: hypothetical protein EOP05_05460 [Proteobacteria bacterium]|nr:MAG: hypothetical protein EOP05_05460 [Pseudomonadota bacterium]